MESDKIIPLAVPNLTGNERKYLNECIDTTFVSSVGEFVKRLEEMTAKATGARYAAATSSGTTALHMALVACGVKADEIVIIPSFTFIATANAVSHCNAEPWCIDIDEDSWTISPELLESILKEETIWNDGKLLHKKTKRRVAAIMPVYTLGNVPDMDKIRAIANQYDLPIVADAAAAIGAKYKGRNIAELADATAISFNGNKTITAGGGGMVVSNNKTIIDLIHHISSTARIGTEYDHDMVGYNYRMTNIQAAVGCAQLERLEEFVEKKRYIREYYHKKLNEIKEITLFPIPDWQQSSCWFSGVLLNDKSKKTVKELRAILKKKGIDAGSFWKPIHLQKPYNDVMRSNMIVTEDIWGRIITLPCSTGISEEDLCYVVSEVYRCLE